jgi:hypothetical protein
MPTSIDDPSPESTDDGVAEDEKTLQGQVIGWTVKLHVTGAVMALPYRSVARTEAVYEVPGDIPWAGVKVAVRVVRS